MFGPLGAMEILFIMVLALLIFGPRRLPEVGRTVGKALGEFRRATNDLKRSVNAELALEEERPLPRRPGSPPSAIGATGAGAAAGATAGAGPRPAVGTHPRTPLGGPPGDGSEEDILPGLELDSERQLLRADEEKGGAVTGPEGGAGGGSGEPLGRADTPPAAGAKAAG